MDSSWALGHTLNLVEMALGHADPARIWKWFLRFITRLAPFVVFSMHETLAERGQLDHRFCRMLSRDATTLEKNKTQPAIACVSHPFRLSLRLALLSTCLDAVHGLIDQDISRIRLTWGDWQNP